MREILIIDDSEDDRILFAHVLEDCGGGRYSVVEAESGEAGVELCRSRRPDCVLLGFDLPEMNGLGVLRALSGDEGNLIPVPVIMLSGSNDPAVQEGAIAAGAQDYIPKGQITSELLLRAIQLAIGRHQHLGKARFLAEELRRSRESLEQLAYVVSHDLQEPLRMVRSFLQLLERRNDGKLDADSVEFIGFAVEGAARLQDQLQDLLRYSRAGRGLPELNLTPVDEVVDSALEKLDRFVRDAGAVVKRDVLPTVAVDPAGLGQVFQSLIQNAIKFHGQDAPRVNIAAELDGSHWMFSVTDNGVGIDMHFSERIFEVFQRLHSRSEYAGTGIGLAICRRVVEQHGGRIWVESAPGEGSSFRFTLPAGDGAT